MIIKNIKAIKNKRPKDIKIVPSDQIKPVKKAKINKAKAEKNKNPEPFFKTILHKKITFNIYISLAVILFFALLSSFTNINFSINSIRDTLSFFTDTPYLALLNTLPILLLSLIIFMLFNNAVFAAMVSSAVFVLLGYINNVKIVMRQDPLIPSDLTLFTEVFEIVKGFSLRTVCKYILFFGIAFMAVLIAALFFRNKKIKPVIRVALFLALCLSAFLLNNHVYKNEVLYNSFYVDGNQYFEVNQYNSKGFVYCFIYKYNTNKIEKPKNYDKTYFDNMNNDYKAASAEDFEDLPNIIMIMGEAYSDLSENEHLDFSGYTDPMENFKAIAQEENAESGHIVVPNFGGGTSDTEFEVLTGYFKQCLDSQMTAYSLIRKNIDALPWRLKDIGYDTLAIHPGYPWFYNRSNVYNYMGFDSFISLESFQGKEKYHGGYIADKYTTDMIIDKFEEHTETSSSPFFEFCVTIQNHGPYDEKYNEVEKMFDTDVDLTENEETMLNSYFMGIRDADIEIKRLTDYFEKSNEPVIIVYFGDHLPGFSNGMDFFDILDYNIDANGTDEQFINIYSTPYLIWQNDAASKINNFAELKDEISVPYNTMNSAFLGAYIMQLTGINNISPVFDVIDEMRNDMSVITSSRYLLSDGTYTEELTDEQIKKTDILKQMIYYEMFE